MIYTTIARVYIDVVGFMLKTLLLKRIIRSIIFSLSQFCFKYLTCKCLKLHVLIRTLVENYFINYTTTALSMCVKRGKNGYDNFVKNID